MGLTGASKYAPATTPATTTVAPRSTPQVNSWQHPSKFLAAPAPTTTATSTSKRIAAKEEQLDDNIEPQLLILKRSVVTPRTLGLELAEKPTKLLGSKWATKLAADTAAAPDADDAGKQISAVETASTGGKATQTPAVVTASVEAKQVPTSVMVSVGETQKRGPAAVKTSSENKVVAVTTLSSRGGKGINEVMASVAEKLKGSKWEVTKKKPFVAEKLKQSKWAA